MEDWPNREIDPKAFDAEADRLFGIYLRLRTQAQKERVEIHAVGLQALQAGDINERDWAVLRELLTTKDR